MTAVHGATREASSPAFPIFPEHKDTRGAGKLSRDAVSDEEFQKHCHGTDDFLAFVQPPSSTLGDHWKDDNVPFMGRVAWWKEAWIQVRFGWIRALDGI